MIRADRLEAIRVALCQGRWRTPVVLTVSVLAHALVLGFLALRTFDLEVGVAAPPPPLYVEIEPRPLLEGEVLRPPRVASMPETAVASASDTLSLPTELRTPPQDEDDEAVQAETRPASPGATGTDLVDPAWLARPIDERARVASSLRTSTVGCNARNGRMPAAEQALCDEAFNEGAARARPISGSGNAARDARLAAEGRRETEAYEARRRPLAGGTGVTGVGDCPGSNFGMGCPGALLDPGYRQDTNETLDEGLGDRRRAPED